MTSKTKLMAAAFLFGLLCSNVCAQTSTGSGSGAKAKSAINLLPGYKMQILPGIDSAAAKIWKEGGLHIEVELCCGFGDAADSVQKKDLLWKEEQTVNDQHAVVALTRTNELIVTFPRLVTNFRTKIKNYRELTQALLMILSYDQGQRLFG